MKKMPVLTYGATLTLVNGIAGKAVKPEFGSFPGLTPRARSRRPYGTAK
jgi:hypothetical protein